MVHRFEDFELDPQLRELRKEGAAIDVEPQVFDLLLYLIDNAEHVVSKDELLEHVWGGRIVSESTLSSRINAVRRILSDDGNQQRVIRTVPRRGFRFVAEYVKANEHLVDSDPICSIMPAGHSCWGQRNCGICSLLTCIGRYCSSGAARSNAALAA